ncbi:hypothetical protein ACGVWS_15195 [Enterobacteriaceae bacterium LUAb1]
MGIKKCLPYILLLLPLSVQAGREVENIVIEKSGHYDELVKEDPYNYREWCKGWNPTKEQLIDYFTKAKEADSNAGLIHDYYSPCIAIGTVTFKDGSYGEWGIHDTGYGVVDFKDKANNTIKQRYFLNLKSKWLEE